MDARISASVAQQAEHLALNQGMQVRFLTEAPGGCSSMAERQLAMLETGVRFPVPAPPPMGRSMVAEMTVVDVQA
jgi:hypothetical protein